MDNYYCSICLKSESRFFLFIDSESKSFIKNFIRRRGYNPVSHDKERICYECKALLGKSFNFMQKAVKAQVLLKNLMMEMGWTNGELPFDVIKSLNRNQINLDTLKIKNIDIDFYFIDTMDIDGNLDINIENIKSDHSMLSDDDSGNDTKPILDLWEESGCDGNSKIEIKDENRKNNTRIETVKQIMSVKKVKKPPVQSKFMQSIQFVVGKRSRREVNYENMDIRLETEKNVEYQPKPERLDTNSIGLYNKCREELKRDVRVFPMQCEQCPVEILNKRQHHYHYMEIHPGIPYPYRVTRAKHLLCQKCGKTFTRNFRYEDHLKTHAAERKETCDKCGKKFARRAQLNKHLKRHDENIRFDCDVCKKIFKTRLELRTHMRIHTGDKPYKCHICGAGFAHNGNVGVHIRAKHQQAPSDNNCKLNIRNKPKNQTKRKLSKTIENGIKDSTTMSNHELLEKTQDIKETNSLDGFEFLN